MLDAIRRGPSPEPAPYTRRPPTEAKQAEIDERNQAIDRQKQAYADAAVWRANTTQIDRSGSLPPPEPEPRRPLKPLPPAPPFNDEVADHWLKQMRG